MGVVRFTVRRIAIGILGLLTATSSCLNGTSLPNKNHNDSETFEDPPIRSQLQTIAILAPTNVHTKEVWGTMVSELTDSFNIVTVPIELRTTPTQLGTRIDEIRPSCVVLINNRTVNLYRELQRSQTGRTFPPAVVVMTSFLEQIIGSLRNATGIAYEVPAVSSFVALREVTTTPIQKVGVVYRDAFSDTISKQTKLAAVEKINLIAIRVRNNPRLAEIDDAITLLLDDYRVDALWVLNDNVLLSQSLLQDTWLPRIHQRPIPVVVGVSALVQPDMKFGSFAVLPNHQELGVQAAQLILDIGENHWWIPEHKVELPLRVRTVADVNFVQTHFGLRADALSKIDETVR
jgi:hypothetical protein